MAAVGTRDVVTQREHASVGTQAAGAEKATLRSKNGRRCQNNFILSHPDLLTNYCPYKHYKACKQDTHA